MAEARAPLIVFLDDDVVPDERLIGAHLEAHINEPLRITIGPLLPPLDYRLNAWGAWEERALCRQYAAMQAGQYQASYRQFYTGNAAVLKRHLVEAGGFDAAFRRAEDVEVALRLRDRGLQFVFLPEARGWHYVSRSFDAWQRMASAYGAADVTMASAGHPHVLVLAGREFHQRNRLAQMVTRLCAGRPRAAGVAVALLGAMARVADVVRLVPLGNLACSVIFNLRYYDGITEALGGRAALRDLVSEECDLEMVRRLQERATLGLR